jgi:hypothetical protein
MFAIVLRDQFSGMTYIHPIKSKKAEHVKAGLQALYRDRRVPVPKLLQSDFGMEFRASLVQKYLKRLGITWLVTKSEIKAAACER